MSHFTVLIAFEEKPDDLTKAIAEVMAPYDEGLAVEPYQGEDGEETTWNPQGYWDWYCVGGRWSGYFPGTPHARMLTEFAMAGNGGKGYAPSNGLVTGFDERTSRLRFDAGPKGMLGIAEMRDEAGIKAGDDWDEYQAIIFGTPEHRPWSYYRELSEKAEQEHALATGQTWKTFIDGKYDEARVKHGWATEEELDAFIKTSEAGTTGSPESERYKAYSGEVNGNSRSWHEEWLSGLAYTINDARLDYAAQPRITRLRVEEKYKGWWEGPEEEFEPYDREQYIMRKRMQAVPTFAFIGRDGLWRAPGQMGWFGMSSAEDGDKDAFHAQLNKTIDALPDETYLVLVDAHV